MSHPCRCTRRKICCPPTMYTVFTSFYFLQHIYGLHYRPIQHILQAKIHKKTRLAGQKKYIRIFSPASLALSATYSILLQQAQNTGAILICLCQHGLCRLQQHIVFGVFRHFLGHIRITDDRLRADSVFTGDIQVGTGVLHSAGDSTYSRNLIKCPINGFIKLGNSCFRLDLGCYLECFAILVHQSHGLGINFGQC